MSFPSPGDHPEPGTQPTSLAPPAMAGRFFSTVPHGKSSLLGSPSLIAIWSPDWEKALGSVSTARVRLQTAVLGAPTYNPKLQTDIISLCAKMQLWFYLNILQGCLFLCCESYDFAKPGVQLARPPGAQEFQDPLPFLSKVLHDCLR